jgi:hypothetical protein
MGGKDAAKYFRLKVRRLEVKVLLTFAWLNFFQCSCRTKSKARVYDLSFIFAPHTFRSQVFAHKSVLVQSISRMKVCACMFLRMTVSATRAQAHNMRMCVKNAYMITSITLRQEGSTRGGIQRIRPRAHHSRVCIDPFTRGSFTQTHTHTHTHKNKKKHAYMISGISARVCVCVCVCVCMYVCMYVSIGTETSKYLQNL